MKRILAILLSCLLMLSGTAMAERNPLFSDSEPVELTLWVDWNWVGFDSYEAASARSG